MAIGDEIKTSDPGLTFYTSGPIRGVPLNNIRNHLDFRTPAQERISGMTAYDAQVASWDAAHPDALGSKPGFRNDELSKIAADTRVNLKDASFQGMFIAISDPARPGEKIIFRQELEKDKYHFVAEYRVNTINPTDPGHLDPIRGSHASDVWLNNQFIFSSKQANIDTIIARAQHEGMNVEILTRDPNAIKALANNMGVEIEAHADTVLSKLNGSSATASAPVSKDTAPANAPTKSAHGTGSGHVGGQHAAPIQKSDIDKIMDQTTAILTNKDARQVLVDDPNYKIHREDLRKALGLDGKPADMAAYRHLVEGMSAHERNEILVNQRLAPAAAKLPAADPNMTKAQQDEIINRKISIPTFDMPVSTMHTVDVKNSELVAGAVMDGVLGLSKPGHHGGLKTLGLPILSNDLFGQIDKDKTFQAAIGKAGVKDLSAESLSKFRQAIEVYHKQAIKDHEATDKLQKAADKTNTQKDHADDKFGEHLTKGHGKDAVKADGAAITAQTKLEEQNRLNDEHLAKAKQDLQKLFENDPQGSKLIRVANQLMDNPVDLAVTHTKTVSMYAGTGSVAANAIAATATPGAATPPANFLGAPTKQFTFDMSNAGLSGYQSTTTFGLDSKPATSLGLGGKIPAPGQPGGPVYQVSPDVPTTVTLHKGQSATFTTITPGQ